MISKLVLMALAGGVALIGAVLFTRPNFPEKNTAPIQQIETVNLAPAPYRAEGSGSGPTPQSTKIFKPRALTPSPKITATLLPETVLLNTPTPLPTNPLPSVTPEASITATPVSSPTTSPTPSTTPLPQPRHIFYTSSHWKAKYYYCDTDSGWKKLSATYLKSFNSEEELLRNYSRISHEPCKD